MFVEERKKATLFLRQTRANHNVPGEDIVEKLRARLESHTVFDQEVPEWFIKGFLLEVGLRHVASNSRIPRNT